MEDATDFTWQGAKAAYAVLMCEMERGSLQWEDTDRIDRIQRAHAQKHAPGKGGWAKPSDPGRKPWFCKNFQSGNCTHTRDHEFNGKLQKHICAFCLMGGIQLGHAEKDFQKFQEAKPQKRPSSCPSLGRDSCSSGSQYKVQVNPCKSSVKADTGHIFERPRKHECKNSNVKHYRTRFFYNSSVKPKVIEASLARKSSDSITYVKNVVKTRNLNLGSIPKRYQNQNYSDIDSVVKNGTQCNLSPPVVHPVALSSNRDNNVRDEQILGVEEAHADVKQGTVSGLGLNPNMTQHSDHNDPLGRGLNPSKQHAKNNVDQLIASDSDPENLVRVNTACANDPQLTDQCMPIYDVNYAGVEGKFVNSIMHFNQFSDHIDIADSESHIFQLWHEQSDLDFGFIPLGEQQMPNTFDTNVIHTNNLIEIHEIVRKTKNPNFMQARIPVTSQLNVEVW